MRISASNVFKMFLKSSFLCFIYSTRGSRSLNWVAIYRIVGSWIFLNWKIFLKNLKSSNAFKKDMEYPTRRQYFDLPACMGWQIIWFWCTAEWKQNTAEQFILISVKQRRDILVFYPTITMCEHLCDIVWFKISKTFLGKIITSVDCLHSFQGLFYYIVLSLEGYYIITGSDRQPVPIYLYNYPSFWS